MGADPRKIIAAIDESEGAPGWLVTTKNPRYSGTSAGVAFEDGIGFVSDLDDDCRYIIGRLRDLGGQYQIERLELDDLSELRRILCPSFD